MGRYIVRRILSAIPVLFGLSIMLFALHPPAARRPRGSAPRAARDAGAAGPDPDPARPRPAAVRQQYIQLSVPGAPRRPGQEHHQQPADSSGSSWSASPGRSSSRSARSCSPSGSASRSAASRPATPRAGSTALVTVICLFGISHPGLRPGPDAHSTSSRWSSGILPTTGRIDARIGFEATATSSCSIRHSPAAGASSSTSLHHLILPSIALGSIPLAIIARITRASVIEVANEDYVRTARAKGLHGKSGQRSAHHAQRMAARSDGHRAADRRSAGRGRPHRDGVRLERRRPLGRRRDRQPGLLTIVQSTILVFALDLPDGQPARGHRVRILNPRIRYS